MINGKPFTLDMLPSNQKDGSIFIDENDGRNYFMWFWFCFMTLWLTYYSWEYIFNNVIVFDRFIKRNKRDKVIWI